MKENTKNFAHLSNSNYFMLAKLQINKPKPDIPKLGLGMRGKE